VIPGEVFDFPEDATILGTLDAYEEFRPDEPDGCPFIRREVEVVLEDDRRAACWMYVYNREPEDRQPIVDGRGWSGPGRA
jgi:gamma-glutamylcyclotransferase (GGCT)/AIG2-like uncharacterized protein YtfP